uniref:Uncharacterized protein n=1 Tax=viral metagenome TaxID=1070528 RepID=A0A6M3KUK5_9ZZZZ
MTDRFSDRLREFLATCEGRTVSYKYIRDEMRLDPNSPAWDGLREQMRVFVQKQVVKPSGLGDGVFKVLFPISPVNWWEDVNIDPIADFRFPRNYNEDQQSFGIEDCVEIFPGDMILISGRSNYGKTCMALSLMGENLPLMYAVLMGSEYTASNGKISPKFKRRMRRMDWVNWVTDEGKPRFDLMPVGADYEDYIKPDCLNVVDWISLNGEYYLIDRVMKSIKDRVGHGVAVVVIQKNKDAEFGEGGERTERYADVHLRIDAFGESESLLTIGKVKSPKGRASGRTWAFGVTDYGANFIDIREVVKCRTCWGKGWKKMGATSIPCPVCYKKGYVDKVIE